MLGIGQVETLLEQLDTKFEDMSSQILERSEWHAVFYGMISRRWASEQDVRAC